MSFKPLTSRSVSYTHLAADDSSVITRIIGIQHLVSDGNGSGRIFLGRRQVIGQGGGNCAHRTVLKSSLGDQRHVIGRGIVVIVVEPVGIGKMRVGAAQGRGPGVHHIRKLGVAARHVLRQSVAHLVGGF